MAQSENSLSRLCELLKQSRKTVVLTGAGVSTLSGIPDFRSANGLYAHDWHGMRIEDILSLDVFRVHPEYFYALKIFLQPDDAYAPNIVHTTLAEMQKRKLIGGIFTQNIDRLHTIAGATDVVELHGSAQHNHCLKCHAHYPLSDIIDTAMKGEVPRCPQCGGVIKPDIVFYGENLVEEDLTRAFNDFAHADLALVLGTSLVVYPVAALPEETVRHGGKLVIVNAQPTMMDRYAELTFTDLKSTFEGLHDWLTSEGGIASSELQN